MTRSYNKDLILFFYRKHWLFISKREILFESVRNISQSKLRNHDTLYWKLF